MTGQLRRLHDVAASWGIADADENRRMANWLADQINAGRIVATKLGRHWWMNQAQIDAALDAFSNKGKRKPVKAIAVEPEPPRRGLSAASARRRSA